MKNQGETPPITQGVDQSRRRLTKAGLAAPVVLGVLASRPVLGQSLHNCTPSGHISGFASPNPNGTVCATLGSSPDDYTDPATWPTGFKDQDNNPLPFNQAPTTTTLTFSDAYVIVNNGGQVTRIATVEEVLKGQYVGNLGQRSLSVRSGYTDPGFTLGKEAIAACMNALSGYPQDFPISGDQVVRMFNNVILTGGLEQVTSTADWNRTEVIAYFQTLHG